MDVPDEDSKAFNGQMVPFFSSEESDNVGFTWFYSFTYLFKLYNKYQVHVQ